MHTETLLAHADPAQHGFCPQRLQHLQAAFEAEVARGRLPGAVLLLARRGKTLLHAAVGQQDPALPTPMALDTLFRIYSMTKPLVSVAALMLMERGQLALGAPVARYLPEFAQVQLLDTSTGTAFLRAPRRAPTVQDLLRHTAADWPTKFSAMSRCSACTPRPVLPTFLTPTASSPGRWRGCR